MCGFAGFINSSLTQDKQRRILKRMSAQLARRGPDDEQVILDNKIAFVFRRLAIVDLESGQQPIWNEKKSIFAAVNGEIYNHLPLRKKLQQKHQFRSKSDSEIVLHLYEEYGHEMLKWLNGMFAIAIWDTKKEELFIARDRLGIKPLYYVHDNNIPFIFGSEIKALLTHPECPRRLNWDDLSVSWGYRSSRLTTFVEGIETLPGGFCAKYKNGEFRKFRYWSIDECIRKNAAVSKNSADFQKEYSEILCDSVKLRLMSDVPVGSFLSGGLDSSIITTLASRENRQIHCLNIVEKMARESGDTARAAKLAEFLDIPIHQVLFNYDQLTSQISFSLETFEYFIWLMDAPRFDPEWIFKHELHRYAKTVEPGLKVILIGQGADEFAGGYSNPYDAPQPNWASYIDKLKRKQEIEMLKSKGVPAPLVPLISGSSGIHRPDSLSTFHREMLGRILSLQFHNLWHEDRTGAAQGIETRVPFLDHRLVELLASVPETLHSKLFWDKHIIRQAAKQWLPESFLQAPKIRFFASQDKSPINNFLGQITRNIFPAFRENYLKAPSSLFSESKLVEIYQYAAGTNAAAVNALRMLLSCMAVAVFESICRRLKDGWYPTCLDPPSPLSTINLTAKVP